MTKQQTIELLEKQLPSFYSLQQVIDIVKGIDDTPIPGTFNIEELANVVKDAFDDYDTSDMIDYDNIDLSINYNNQIEVEGVGVDLENLKQSVIETVREYFEKSY